MQKKTRHCHLTPHLFFCGVTCGGLWGASPPQPARGGDPRGSAPEAIGRPTRGGGWAWAARQCDEPAAGAAGDVLMPLETTFEAENGTSKAKLQPK